MSDLQTLMREKLEAGWDWMKEAPDGEAKDTFFDEKFKPLMACYEALYGFDGSEDAAMRQLRKKEQPLPAPSEHIEELREQLMLSDRVKAKWREAGRLP